MRFKITVVKKMYHEDIAREHLKNPGPCPLFQEGDEFFHELGEGAQMYRHPAGFCGRAWSDLLRHATWFLNDPLPERPFIACCSDGTRPVVFRLERVG